MKPQKSPTQINYNTILTIIISIALFLIILTSGALIIKQLSPVNDYIFECKAYGGNYWETTNVDCKTFYPYCALNCNLNGKDYNYYDGKLCVLDCNYENEKAGGLVCVC